MLLERNSRLRVVLTFRLLESFPRHAFWHKSCPSRAAFHASSARAPQINPAVTFSLYIRWREHLSSPANSLHPPLPHLKENVPMKSFRFIFIVVALSLVATPVGSRLRNGAS